VFRAAVANDPVFARAVDADDTFHAMDEVAEYDVFCDGLGGLPGAADLAKYVSSNFLRNLTLFRPSDPDRMTKKLQAVPCQTRNRLYRLGNNYPLHLCSCPHLTGLNLQSVAVSSVLRARTVYLFFSFFSLSFLYTSNLT
jgi:hypothetical protein